MLLKFNLIHQTSCTSFNTMSSKVSELFFKKWIDAHEDTTRYWLEEFRFKVISFQKGLNIEEKILRKRQSRISVSYVEYLSLCFIGYYFRKKNMHKTSNLRIIEHLITFWVFVKSVQLICISCVCVKRKRWEDIFVEWSG